MANIYMDQPKETNDETRSDEQVSGQHDRPQADGQGSEDRFGREVQQVQEARESAGPSGPQLDLDPLKVVAKLVPPPQTFRYRVKELPERPDDAMALLLYSGYVPGKFDVLNPLGELCHCELFDHRELSTASIAVKRYKLDPNFDAIDFIIAERTKRATAQSAEDPES